MKPSFRPYFGLKSKRQSHAGYSIEGRKYSEKGFHPALIQRFS